MDRNLWYLREYHTKQSCQMIIIKYSLEMNRNFLCDKYIDDTLVKY